MTTTKPITKPTARPATKPASKPPRPAPRPAANDAPAGPPPPRRRGATLAQRMQRGELMAAECPSRSVLQHVTSRWGVLVLVALQGGMQRFSDLRRTVGGVSEKMLAQTLQGLEGDGFVLRTAYPVVPPRVEYTLTPLGEEVARHVATLADWIEANLGRVMAARQAGPATPA